MMRIYGGALTALSSGFLMNVVFRPSRSEIIYRISAMPLPFFRSHWGEVPSLSAVLNLTVIDFRSFLAFRLNQKINKRSNARSLASWRCFFKYLALKNPSLENLAISFIQIPKIDKKNFPDP